MQRRLTTDSVESMDVDDLIELELSAGQNQMNTTVQPVAIVHPTAHPPQVVEFGLNNAAAGGAALNNPPGRGQLNNRANQRLKETQDELVRHGGREWDEIPHSVLGCENGRKPDHLMNKGYFDASSFMRQEAGLEGNDYKRIGAILLVDDANDRAMEVNSQPARDRIRVGGRAFDDSNDVKVFALAPEGWCYRAPLGSGDLVDVSHLSDKIVTFCYSNEALVDGERSNVIFKYEINRD